LNKLVMTEIESIMTLREVILAESECKGTGSTCS